MAAILRPDPELGQDMAELRKRAGAHLVQPWPEAGKIGVTSLGMLGDAEGIYVTDEAGRRLIDGPAGMWCVNVGHRRAELADVMRDQAMELSYNSPWYTTSAPSVQLAERLGAYAPGDLNRVFLTTGGSSAVETALRLMMFINNVKGRPEKKKVVSREKAYHGSTYLSGTMNARPKDQDWMDSAKHMVVRLSCPNRSARPEGMSEEAFADQLVAEFAAAIAREGAETIGAFIAEPVMASGGVVVPPKGYLLKMQALCRQHDILFISDEVVTGFGRLGHVFASKEVFGLEPDMITFAKGVTSGYFPLGGVMISEALLEDLRASNHPEASFSHGLTYSSHPIGCAVALKNLELLEGGILDHVRAISGYFQDSLKRLEALPLVGEVRGLGLMACVNCEGGGKGAAADKLNLEIGKRVDRRCQELGLLVRPLGNMCVMSPPLIITREQIDRMVEILDQSIRQVTEDLSREGLWSAA